MKLLVGLGNPGAQYAQTRHNIGFMAVDRFVERAGGTFSRRRFEAETAEVHSAGEKVLVVKPQTFMNLSGRSVAAAAGFFKSDPAEILVVHDELDLPLGTVRLKRGGGTAGHNGLKSISAQIGKEFMRLRLGIGKPEVGRAAVSHVLAPFQAEEKEMLAQTIDLAQRAMDLWIERGLEHAMQEIHSTA